jgi:phage FluMu gp28-like protein
LDYSCILSKSRKTFLELLDASHKIIKQSNKAELTLEFVNGSTLQFLSAERYDSIRGFSFSHMVVDEAAFIKEIAMQEAIYPTLSALGKKCLIISTPKSKNWFYNAYLKGSNGGSDYISFAVYPQITRI